MRSHENEQKRIAPDFVSCLAVMLLFLWTAGPAGAQPQCKRTISASVVALPQPIMLNRLGAAIPDGLIFALKSDTESNSGTTQLKPTKRPRPLVLRANVGDCLTITFENAIPQSQFPGPTHVGTPTNTTSELSLHIQGVEWVAGAQDDGAFAGVNNSSLASVNPPPASMPPSTQTYTLFAREEGTFLMYTMGDTSTSGDQLTRGLFGALNVQPSGAEWYRSQVTADDLALATYNANSLPANATLNAGCTPAANCTLTITGPNARPPFAVKRTPGGLLNTLDNHPLINYDATYTDGTPILKMLDSGNKLVHGDLTAIITGPNAGRFPGTTGINNPEPACNAENSSALNPPPGGKVDPLFCANPSSPDRKQPYRELTILYHGALSPIAAQAFPILANAPAQARHRHKSTWRP